MTLEQCWQANQGTSILVPGGGAGNEGQCVQWADTVLHDVYGLPYIYTPAALDWWNNADALGLTNSFDKIPVGEPIQTGDFIIYDQRVGAPEGHIDVASADGTIDNFTAYDSNWGGQAFYKNGYPILHQVVHNDKYNSYVVGYLRLKGEDMEVFKDANEVRLAWLNFGYDKPGSINDGQPNPDLTNWVDESKLSFYEGLGPEVVNDMNALRSQVAKLQNQVSAQNVGGTALDATTQAEIANTNSVVNQILAFLKTIFIGSK